MSGFTDPIAAMLDMNSHTIKEMEDLVTSLASSPPPSPPSEDMKTLTTQDPLYKDRTSYTECPPCPSPPQPVTSSSLQASAAAVLLASEAEDRRCEELRAKFAPPTASRKDRTSFVTCPPCAPSPPPSDDGGDEDLMKQPIDLDPDAGVEGDEVRRGLWGTGSRDWGATSPPLRFRLPIMLRWMEASSFSWCRRIPFAYFSSF